MFARVQVLKPCSPASLLLVGGGTFMRCGLVEGVGSWRWALEGYITTVVLLSWLLSYDEVRNFDQRSAPHQLCLTIVSELQS